MLYALAIQKNLQTHSACARWKICGDFCNGFTSKIKVSSGGPCSEFDLSNVPFEAEATLATIGYLDYLDETKNGVSRGRYEQ